MLTLSDDSYATCGSRFPQMGNTAMTDLWLYRSVQVLERLRGGADVGVMAWETVTSQDNGNVCYVVLKDVGPPVLAVTDVLNSWVPFPQTNGGLTSACPRADP